MAHLEVDVGLTVSDSTASQCLRILEIWQSQNPNKIITADKSGPYVTYKIVELEEQVEIE